MNTHRPRPSSPLRAAMMGVLRRVTRDQLLAHLNTLPAAPFHWLRWNDEPVRLEEACKRAQACDPRLYFYVRGEQIYGPIELDPRAQDNGRLRQ